MRVACVGHTGQIGVLVVYCPLYNPSIELIEVVLDVMLESARLWALRDFNIHSEYTLSGGLRILWSPKQTQNCPNFLCPTASSEPNSRPGLLG